MPRKLFEPPGKRFWLFLTSTLRRPLQLISTVTVRPSTVVSVPSTEAVASDRVYVKATSSPGSEKAPSDETLPSHSNRWIPNLR